jgi:DNA-binding transcriptional LysR family regulator
VKVVVVAAPSYLARRAPPRAPSDLAAHDCIRMRLPNGGTLPWRFQGKRGRFEQAVRGPLVVNDRELELRAALDGVGLAYLPSIRVADALADGRLVSVLDDWTPPVTSFQLYYPSRRQIPAPLRALLDFVRAEAPGAAAKAPARRTRRPARR